VKTLPPRRARWRKPNCLKPTHTRTSCQIAVNVQAGGHKHAPSWCRRLHANVMALIGWPETA
jgi:hypothetical protein